MTLILSSTAFANDGMIPTKQQVQDALAPLLLAEAELIGRYSRT